MLFLLNDVVFDLDEACPVTPADARRFQKLGFDYVLELGCELFAEDPLLHFDKPERARRLATLIIAKAPSINAALFVAPAYGCAPEDVTLRYANVDFEVMARLSSRQDQGMLDTVWTDRQVWRRLAA